MDLLKSVTSGLSDAATKNLGRIESVQVGPWRRRNVSSGPGGLIIIGLFLVMFIVFGILAIVSRKKQPIQLPPSQPVEQKKEGFNRLVPHPMSHGRVFMPLR